MILESPGHGRCVIMAGLIVLFVYDADDLLMKHGAGGAAQLKFNGRPSRGCWG